MDDTEQCRTARQSEKAGPCSSMMSQIRSVIEKHGGQMEIDETNNTFTVIISENRKDSCLRELTAILGPSEPISDTTFFVH